MHKCVNNTIGNVYHLEQMVDNFFPYSQKQLGFDKPATIIFQSDEDNATRMLGKTAYYNPETFEVVLYTDNRHPKDVMRSLSHELVHHAQNCRGDFAAAGPTEEGYAQSDPHLRKMEREAYTKGNLIFRDFEDLIKTGKINIEIDFSDSGEPKMSLKEWKNNEINTKLMQKWGLLKEEKKSFPDLTGDGKVTQADILKGRGVKVDEAHCARKEDDDLREEKDEPADVAHADRVLSGEEESESGSEALKKLEEDSGEDEAWNDWKNEHADDDHIREIRHHLRALEEDRDHDRHDAEYDHDDYEDDRKDEGVIPRAVAGKISVREAKEITRRIVERIRKEGK